MEKGSKKQKRPPTDEMTGPLKKGRHYPPIDDTNVIHEEVYQHHLRALDTKLKKSCPRQEKVLCLMSDTFVNHREFVLEQAISVKQILEQFPAFKSAETVRKS